MLKQDLMNIMDKIAPRHLSENWDNVGMLIDVNDEINGIMLTVDVTKEFVYEAKEKGVNLIITHHPVIFNGLKNLSYDDVAYHAIKNDISIFSAHTNMDAADNGINYGLAKLLELKDIKLLNALFEESFGAIGDLEQDLKVIDFCKFVKEKLGNASLRVCGDESSNIKKVVVCGGSGADMIPYALELKADAIITSEVKHNHYIDNLNKNICIIDAGHYDTEKHFVNLLKTHLQLEFNNVNCTLAVLTSENDIRPYFIV